MIIDLVWLIIVIHVICSRGEKRCKRIRICPLRVFHWPNTRVSTVVFNAFPKYDVCFLFPHSTQYVIWIHMCVCIPSRVKGFSKNTCTEPISTKHSFPAFTGYFKFTFLNVCRDTISTMFNKQITLFEWLNFTILIHKVSAYWMQLN